MIIDCFMFFNEIDILQLRIKLLYDIVDYFIIIEGDTTFQGEYKDYFFEKNIDLFHQYIDKIIYKKIKIPSIDYLNKYNSEYKDFDNPWKREYYQRDYIHNILNDLECDEGDIISLSDVDEILYPDKLKQIINDLDNVIEIENEIETETENENELEEDENESKENKSEEGKNELEEENKLKENNNNNIYLCHILDIKYYLNNKNIRSFFGNVIFKYKQIDKIKYHSLFRNKFCFHRSIEDVSRTIQQNNLKKTHKIIENSGIHLSSYGGRNMSTIKLYAYSHIEDNKEQIKLNNNIQIIADNLHNSKTYRDTHNMTELSNYDKYYYDIENKLDSKDYNVPDYAFEEIKNNKEKYTHFFIFKNPILD